ncbi:MAG: Na+/H+ antiporter NhaA [Pseudobdellovibrio sp.]
MKNKFAKFFKKPLEMFIQTESSSGIILALSAAMAVVFANSSSASSYFQLLETKIYFLTLRLWINDALMAIFFFVVGLEIKKELVGGELSTFSKAILPVSAAVGGMIFPAIIYTYFNYSSGYLHGWAIPMATDIAFALGVLTLFGSRVPLSLKIFLLALAIVDDLGAVAVIAVFYTEEIKILGLAVSLLAFAAVLLGRYLKLKAYWFYVLFGLIAWCGFLYSGVHATIAGVILGLLTPYSFTDENKSTSYSPVDELIRFLHPWVSFGIMPLFALGNAGISLSGMQFSEVLKNPISTGVIAGLVLGKPVGVMLFTAVPVFLKLAQLPKGTTWKDIFSLSILAGIGFTMSIFVSNLALPADKILYAKAGIFIASVVSAIVGGAAVYFFCKKS